MKSRCTLHMQHKVGSSSPCSMKSTCMLQRQYKVNMYTYSIILQCIQSWRTLHREYKVNMHTYSMKSTCTPHRQYKVNMYTYSICLCSAYEVDMYTYSWSQLVHCTWSTKSTRTHTVWSQHVHIQHEVYLHKRDDGQICLTPHPHFHPHSNSFQIERVKLYIHHLYRSLSQYTGSLADSLLHDWNFCQRQSRHSIVFFCFLAVLGKVL